MRGPEAADWALSRGLSALTSAELAGVMGVAEEQVRQRLHAPVRRGEWVMPVRGLWVPVPPEYRSWGAPPGIELIDAMMRHLSTSYYVGWLTAASLHGAAHHAPQVFQVAATRHQRDRTIGRTRFTFAQRDVAKMPVVEHRTRSGTARVSSIAATALDIATDIRLAGGIDNAATVLIELAELDEFRTEDVAALATRFPAAALRRIGWVLGEFTDRDDLRPLQSMVGADALRPSRLDPSQSPAGRVDRAWMLYVNRDVDPDA
ncbi:hypothetical protein CIK77_10740 [Microbacterium sp. JB110]|nr:hypothetical protein CIK77_10740 [Microbacterium sp. JB110]SJM64783.1 hypothetical protein CZ774_13095 [Frigoribacterium sp. JB110]